MSDKEPRTPWNPEDYLVYGLIGGVIGGVILAAFYDSAPALGFIILGLSSLVFQIGVIAKGVEVGLRAGWPTQDDL
jgi:hypothetical protein